MEEAYEVKKLDQPVRWIVEVPGSKSITNRALLIAALTGGKVELNGVLFSDDSRYFLNALKALGFRADIREEQKQVLLTGCGGDIPRSEGEVYVGSAGTAARFLTAMLGVAEGTYVIQASPQMQKRPMRPLFEALLSLGAEIEWMGEEWHLPVRIIGAGYQREHAVSERVSADFAHVCRRTADSYYQPEDGRVLYTDHPENDGRFRCEGPL